MCPEIIVLIGDYISQDNHDDESYDKIKSYFEAIGGIIRNNHYPCLKELTQWIIMPSLNDPGMVQVFPSFKLSELFM